MGKKAISIPSEREADFSYNKLIELKKYQVPHSAFQRKALAKYGVTVDPTSQGGGKSFTAMYITQTIISKYKKLLGTKGSVEMIVVCKSLACTMWKTYISEHGIPAKVLSYEDIRGMKKGNPRCPYLNRKEKEFVPTEELVTAIKNGVLIVLDEIHNLCGNSIQGKAAVQFGKTLAEIREKDPSCESGIMLLSNTPPGKENSPLKMLQLAGIIKQTKLIKPRGTSRKDWLGFRELYDWCLCVSRAVTEKEMRFCAVSTKNVLQYVLKLYTAVVRDEITHSCDVYFEKKVVHVKERLDRDRFVDVAGSIANFEMALNIYDRGVSFPGVGGINMNPTFMAFDKAKAESMIRLYRKVLETKQCKVALFVWFNCGIDYLIDGFKDYDPIVLRGEKAMSREKRDATREALRNEFQEPNGRRRVLIANADVAGESLSFDDRHGDWKRYVCVASSYRQITQIKGRFSREGSKSVPEIAILSFERFVEDRNVSLRQLKKQAMSNDIKGGENKEALFDESMSFDAYERYLLA